MITELGYFWNSWADRQRNVVLVVCGSATSWMLDNVIRDYGGLHGRITETMRLLPFTLKECEMYFQSRGFHLSRYEMAVAYMAFGGIPYYLDRIDNEKNLSENIDAFFFKDTMIDQEVQGCICRSVCYLGAVCGYRQGTRGEVLRYDTP